MLLAGQGCAVSSGGEWNSESIPGLVSDFDTRTGVATTGALVNTWTAARGLPYIFTNVGTNPQYDAAGWVGTRRTVPAIVFDGANDRLSTFSTIGGLELAKRLLNGTDQPGTILFVYQLTSPGTLGTDFALMAFSKVGLTTSDQCVSLAVRDATDHIYRNRKRDDALVNKVVDSATTIIDANKHTMAWAMSGTTIEQRLDDVVVASGDFDVGAMTVDRVEIGCVYSANPCDMRFVRALYYSRLLTSDELTAAYTGLNALYG